MATWQEFYKVARLSWGDKTSGRRVRQIISVLRRYDVLHDLTPQKAVAVLEALGPTYVKIGQMASTRSDILPKAYCTRMYLPCRSSRCSAASIARMDIAGRRRSSP